MMGLFIFGQPLFTIQCLLNIPNLKAIADRPATPAHNA